MKEVGNNEREGGRGERFRPGVKVRIEDEERSRNKNHGGVQERAVYNIHNIYVGEEREARETLVCKEVESLPSYCTTTVYTVIQRMYSTVEHFIFAVVP